MSFFVRCSKIGQLRRAGSFVQRQQQCTVRGSRRAFSAPPPSPPKKGGVSPFSLLFLASIAGGLGYGYLNQEEVQQKWAQLRSGAKLPGIVKQSDSETESKGDSSRGKRLAYDYSESKTPLLRRKSQPSQSDEPKSKGLQILSPVKKAPKSAKKDASSQLSRDGSGKSEPRRKVEEAVSELKSELKSAADSLVEKSEQKLEKVKLTAAVLLSDESATDSSKTSDSILEPEPEAIVSMDEFKALQKDNLEMKSFLEEALQKLADGQSAYDDVCRVYAEMTSEMQEGMLQQMEYMEEERSARLKRLEHYSREVRVLQHLVEWHDAKHSTFARMATLNALCERLADEIRDGQSIADELQYLSEAGVLPRHLLSSVLVSDLQLAAKEKGFWQVPTHCELADRFAVIETSLRECAMIPVSGSLFSRLLAHVFSRFLCSEQLPRTGTGAHARISRAGFCVQTGDLESALKELSHLNKDVLFPAEDWLQSARYRLLALTTVRVLRSEILSCGDKDAIV